MKKGEAISGIAVTNVFGNRERQDRKEPPEPNIGGGGSAMPNMERGIAT
jgi:hypothetical protein